jgi:hypothetical protein
MKKPLSERNEKVLDDNKRKLNKIKLTIKFLPKNCFITQLLELDKIRKVISENVNKNKRRVYLRIHRDQRMKMITIAIYGVSFE